MTSLLSIPRVKEYQLPLTSFCFLNRQVTSRLASMIIKIKEFNNLSQQISKQNLKLHSLTESTNLSLYRLTPQTARIFHLTQKASKSPSPTSLP